MDLGITRWGERIRMSVRRARRRTPAGGDRDVSAEWEDNFTHGCSDSALERVEQVLLAMEPPEGFAVHADYTLEPLTAATLPEDVLPEPGSGTVGGSGLRPVSRAPKLDEPSPRHDLGVSADSVEVMDPIVLMGDPSVANIPVDECGEPLEVAGSDFTMSPLKEADDPHRSRLRAGVRHRLLAARTHLPAGVRLCWVEGHRDAQLQARYFDSYRQQLQALDPTQEAEASYLRASRYVSPPAVAPHVSGAAIDLTLCDEDGNELDMGTRVNASPEESDGACYFDARVSDETRANRTVLARALSEVGLVNYPTEWWHWSYGDRYWALTTGAAAAIYGPLAD